MKRIVIIVLINFLILQLFAQTRITGSVKDESGFEMIGSTVVQKGTNNGVITDINGNFTIELKPNAVKILQISMIGYTKEDIDVSKSTTVKIILGYGTQKKVSVTGAISSVSNKDLKDIPVSSVSNALTGKIAGLVTRQVSGRPGDDGAQLFIRGQASFNSTAPLILVDGIERSFDQIDSDDIENISVLKDASATAVYGVRGANGVILVTTKRGVDGKAKISFSTEYGITNFNSIPRQLNAENTARLQREGTTNEGLSPSDIANTNNYPVSEYDMYLYRTQLSPFTHPDNNLVDMFTKPGNQQKYNFNVSGGNKMLKYFVALGYFNQNGMFQTDINEIRKTPTVQKLISLSPEVGKSLVAPDYDPSYSFKRITARSNLDIQINEDLKVGIDMSYRFGRTNSPDVYGIIDGGSGKGGEGMRLFALFIRNPPQAFPLMNPNGSFAGAAGRWRQNPIITLSYTGYDTDYDNSMETSFSLNYDLRKIVRGLSLDGKFAYDNAWKNHNGMGLRPYLYSYNPVNKAYTQGLSNALPKLASDRTPSTISQYGEIALRYKTTFNKKHNVSGVVLANLTTESGPTTSNKIAAEYQYVPHIYQALIGRANYDFENRYLFEINMGYNGSNRFSEGNRYTLFPAASLGWVLTNESFIPKNDILNFAKFRGSAGQVGNDKLGAFSYYYQSTYGNGAGYSFGSTNNTNVTGLIEGTLPNDMITWETATKYNIGFDSKWLKSQLSLNIDLFKENRTDILTKPGQYIISAGSNGLPPSNLGIVENKGFEVELGWNQTIQKFSYNLKGIVAFAQNKILEKSEAAQPYDYMYQKGHPIWQYFGYQFDGFYNSYEEIAAAPQQFGLSTLVPGDMRYKDINGDGVINNNDISAIGFSQVPELTYSFQVGFSYDRFDLSLMFQGATRVSVYPNEEIGWDNRSGSYFPEHYNRWTPETASTATYPNLKKGSAPNTNNYYLSDFWLKDGSYLRLKNLQLGYTFPKKWFKKTPISSLKIYANGFNLLTWTDIKYMDPEVDPSKDNGWYYPQQKVYNMGLNVTF